MLVTPSPVSLLIVVFEFGEIGIFAMGLFGPRAVRPIFLPIPFMIVIVFLVVIGASSRVILGSQGGWRKSGAISRTRRRLRFLQARGHSRGREICRGAACGKQDGAGVRSRYFSLRISFRFEIDRAGVFDAFIEEGKTERRIDVGEVVQAADEALVLEINRFMENLGIGLECDQRAGLFLGFYLGDNVQFLLRDTALEGHGVDFSIARDFHLEPLGDGIHRAGCCPFVVKPVQNPLPGAQRLLGRGRN